MNEVAHFYPRYGLAWALAEKGLSDLEEISIKDFSELLAKGLLQFRVKPIEDWNNKEHVRFETVSLKEPNPSKGIYLSPTIITSDLTAKSLWDKVVEYSNKASNGNKDDIYKEESVKQLIAPTAGEYNNGKASRQTANAIFREIIGCTITTITSDKPAFCKVVKGKKISYSNTCIIPDLSMSELKKFISVFRRVSKHKTKNLFIGKVSRKTDKKGKLEIKPERPSLFNGNFPNAPKSHTLSALGLLGAIGEWAKEAEDITLANDVFESLKNCPIYIISADETRVTSYNHFIVKLAKKSELSSIIDSIYYITPYRWNSKTLLKDKGRDRELVAFYASRFLHLFDEMALREFLSVRAEYPSQLEILFKTYFMENKQIDSSWVASARSYGQWLNKGAFFIAQKEVDDEKKNYDKKKRYSKIIEIKAKHLVELESLIFSAKTGCALIGHVTTTAGRLFSSLTNYSSDAPSEAALFMEKTISGELPPKEAQQMLMAFSRLRTKSEQKTFGLDLVEDDSEETEDFSDAQDQD